MAFLQRFALPESAEAYRQLGPFTSDTLPAGLLREHRLKPGTWAHLQMLSGEIGFVWDDPGASSVPVKLQEGDTITIPPLVPHHLLALDGPFTLAIAFLALPDPGDSSVRPDTPLTQQARP